MTKLLPAIRPLLATAILAAVLSGTSVIDNPIAIAYLVVFGVLGLATIIPVRAERMTEQIRDSHKAVDPAVRLLGSLLFLATIVVATIDSGRFHWSFALPAWLRIAALGLLALLGSLQLWAMAANPFFSPSLWLHPGHRLVACGPYRVVRHPGYLAMLVSVPATAIALGSLAGLLPALGYGFLILKRMLREDRFLHDRLGGYADYAGIVHWRIIPGLW